MEVSHTDVRPQSNGSSAGRPNQFNDVASPVQNKKKPKHEKRGWLNLRTLFAVLLIGIAVLVIALIAFVINNTFKNESSFVNKSGYQAVFVNEGGSSAPATYFGKIQAINSQYIELTNAFYLVPGTSSNSVPTLSNLNCAIYGPQDTMIIKTDQVSFWTNLKSSSQITTDINKWYTNNISCGSTTSNSTGTSTTNP